MVISLNSQYIFFSGITSNEGVIYFLHVYFIFIFTVKNIIMISLYPSSVVQFIVLKYEGNKAVGYNLGFYVLSLILIYTNNRKSASSGRNSHIDLPI